MDNNQLLNYYYFLCQGALFYYSFHYFTIVHVTGYIYWISPPSSFLSFPLKSTQANWSPTTLQRDCRSVIILLCFATGLHRLPYEEEGLLCIVSSVLLHFLSWCRKANHLAWNGRCWYPLQNSVQNNTRSYWLFAVCWNDSNLGWRA